MRRSLLFILMVLLSVQAYAQVDRKEVRAGNRDFKKGDYGEAEIDYRKAVLKDSLSVAGNYNLASALYKKEDFDGAGKALDAVKDLCDTPEYHFNRGDVALKKKDWKTAVDEFRKALLQTPDDMDAKENYIYAKKMLENHQQQQQNQQDNNQDQNQDQQQQQDQDQDQNQNQNQDQGQDQQNQDQNQPRDKGDQDNQDSQQQQDGKISPQQARQMLRAIQAREKETQDKVKKEKAALLQSSQKEKNW